MPSCTGSFATVFLGTHVETGDQCAIKLFTSGQARERALLEGDMLRRVRGNQKLWQVFVQHPFTGHSNIVSLIDVISDESSVGLVLEFATGGELFKEVIANGGLSEVQAKPLFRQIVRCF